RGYCDFDLFWQWNQTGIFFVTRLKSNAAYEVVEDYSVPEHGNVLTDCVWYHKRGPVLGKMAIKKGTT
ncbi:MAG: hypothetical protein ACE5IA_05910, partial [Dehalococcoidia bacterium]